MVIQIRRQVQLGYKMNLAKVIAGVKEELKKPEERDGYFKRVFTLDLPVDDN